MYNSPSVRKDGSEDHTVIVGTAEDAGRPEKDFSEEQRAEELLRINTGLMNNHH